MLSYLNEIESASTTFARLVSAAQSLLITFSLKKKTNRRVWPCLSTAALKLCGIAGGAVSFRKRRPPTLLPSGHLMVVDRATAALA